jgi:hypothetical protein
MCTISVEIDRDFDKLFAQGPSSSGALRCADLFDFDPLKMRMPSQFSDCRIPEWVLAI